MTACDTRTQAKLVLRWFRDDAPIRVLAFEAGLAISTCYRYLHEAIDVFADQAPDPHNVLGWVKERTDEGSVHDIAAARYRRPPQSSCQLFRGEITEKTSD